jgi:hypothetical protein
MHHPGISCRGNAESHPRGRLKIESEINHVIPGRVEDANPESRDSGFDASHRPGMTAGLNVPHHPPLPRIAHQRDKAIEAVHKFAVGHGDEQREHHAEMQRQ